MEHSLIQWPKDKFPLAHSGMGYNKMSLKVFKTRSCIKCSCIYDRVVEEHDIKIHCSRPVAYRWDTANGCFDALQQAEKLKRWKIRFDLSFHKAALPKE